MASSAVMVFLLASLSAVGAAPAAWDSPGRCFERREEAAAGLIRYFEEMCRPKPFEIRTGDDFKAHRRALREKLLA